MKIHLALLIAALFRATIANARWIPPADPGLVLPGITVLDEASRRRSLEEVLKAAGVPSVLLAPIYTRCEASCPTVVRSLKQGLNELGGGADHLVALFSFDENDTTDDLRRFRARENIPREWLIVRAVNANEARKLLDAFSVRVMETGVGFAHPSQILVLGSGLQWTGSLIEPGMDSGTIREGLKKSRLSPFAARMLRPETWLLVGVLGLLIGMLLLFIATRRLQRAGVRTFTAVPASRAWSKKLL